MRCTVFSTRLAVLHDGGGEATGLFIADVLAAAAHGTGNGAGQRGEQDNRQQD